jgi:hypothetical protein
VLSLRLFGRHRGGGARLLRAGSVRHHLAL